MVPSLLEQVEGLDGPRLIFDDSGDRKYQQWLRASFERQGFTIIYPRDRLRVGQGKTLARMWKHLAGDIYREHPWVFHGEDDFLFDRDIDLSEFREVLEVRPYLAQMALLRQPWFPGEVRAGGIIQRDPEAYTAIASGDHQWLEHRLWFTLNPCLYRRELCKAGWPTSYKHEWHFSRKLCLQSDEIRFGIWGEGEPWVTHIGKERKGRGY
jgi:hypothetical protein